MSCIIDSGYQLGCLDNNGGIANVYAGTFKKEQQYTYNTDNSIIGLTGSTSSIYYTIEQDTEWAELKQPASIGENGTRFFTQNLSLQLIKNDADLMNLLVIMAQSRMSVIIKDNRGEYWLLGEMNGAKVSAAEVGTGKAMGDLNGTTMTITAKEKRPAVRIDNISIFNIVG